MAKSRKNMKSRKSRKTRKSRTRKMRVWNQIGCSHNRNKACKRCKRGGGCGSCSGSIFSRGGNALEVMQQLKNIKGGNCAQCQVIKGGSGSVPPPLIGKAWTPEISGWPGVSGQANYLSMNKYPVDLQTNGIMSSATQNDLTNASLKGISNNTASLRGGRTRRRRGGGFIPQDLVNFGRTFSYGLGSAYNSLSGVPQSPSPLPYKDQLPNTPNANQLRY